MQFEFAVQPSKRAAGRPPPCAQQKAPLDNLQEKSLLSSPVDNLGGLRWLNQPTCYKARSIC